MTDRELSEALQAIDGSEIVSLNYFEADFIDSLQKARRGYESENWWTPKRRKVAQQIIEKYESLL